MKDKVKVKSSIDYRLLKYIKIMCLKQNLILYAGAFIKSVILLLLSLNLIFTMTLINSLTPFQCFFLSLSVRILLILFIIYLFLKAQKDEVSLQEIAIKIDQIEGSHSDTVSNALDFYQKPLNGNRDIMNRYIHKAADIIRNIKFFYDYKSIYLMIIPLFALLFGSSILYFAMNDHAIKTWELFRAKRVEMIVHQEKIQVSPGNTLIGINSHLLIEIINPEPDLRYVLWISQGEHWKKEELINPYRQFYNIDQSFYYCIKSEYGTSDTFFVQVAEEPIVKNLNIKINFPSYTNLKTAYYENSDGNISVLKGSRIKIEATVEENIKNALMVFDDNSYLQMNKTGKQNWELDLTAKETVNYHFSLTNHLNVQSKPISKTLNVISDKEPVIDIVYPLTDTLLNQNLKFNISLQASDDFGLQNLKIHYQINQSLQKESMIKKWLNGTLYQSDYWLDLDDFMLLPGDEITYWLEVEDNSPIRQKSLSKKLKLKFPSIEEIFNQAETQETINKDNLNKALEETKKLQEDFEKKRRELLRKNEPDLDDKKDIKQMLKKQEDLSKIVDNVAQEYQKMINNLEKNKAASNEMLEKMQKIQEIMEEINNPELQKIMQEMQKNIGQMNPETIKKTMENFKFSMEDFTQKLQQTLDLLESVKKEMTLQKLSELSKEVEKMQSLLNEKTKENTNTSDLAKEQKNINDKMKKLQEELNQSLNMFNSDKDKEVQNELQKMSQEIDEDGLKQDMQDAMESLQKNDVSNAQKSQKSSLKKMAQLSQKLEKMKSSMGGGDMQEMMDAIQNTIKRLLLFSKLHEGLNNQFVHDPYPILQDMIANYEGIQMTLHKLYAMPQVLMFLGQKFFYDVSATQTAYREFFSEIQENRFHSVKNMMNNIQKGINMMVFDLIQAINNMQNSGGGGGGGMQSLMQQMQQMGQEQLAMNMMTQSLMQQMMGNGNQMSQQMRQQMQRLATEEQRLADNLKRTLQNNPEAQKHTQQIKQLTDEIEAIAKQLKQGRLDQSVLDRQNRIMSKLLDIEKSVQKREFSQKRKGETNEKENWDVPENVKNRFKDQQRKTQLMEDMKTYPKEYQELIKEYLKSINE
ncbi:MAG TPA: hypothetical protein PK816_01040 [Candidatus Cloacimonadota bacterium]|nr:hypothetical protein [Candidatus Cloacimonadota bacterium]